MRRTKKGPVAIALRKEIRETVQALGLRMPSGFSINTVGDQRLCSGFAAHREQNPGEGWVDHGEWPFTDDRPLRATDECLRQAVRNVLLRMALNMRDKEIAKASPEDMRLPWHVAATALTALAADLRLKAGLDPLEDGRDGLTARLRMDTTIGVDPVIVLRTGGEIETITIACEYPETAMQAMRGKRLRDVVALPDTGRAEIEADIDALTVLDVTATEGFDDVVRTNIRFRSGPLRCATRPPEGTDQTWLSIQEDGMSRLQNNLERGRTSA